MSACRPQVGRDCCPVEKNGQRDNKYKSQPQISDHEAKILVKSFVMYQREKR